MLKHGVDEAYEAGIPGTATTASIPHWHWGWQRLLCHSTRAETHSPPRPVCRVKAPVNDARGQPGLPSRWPCTIEGCPA